MSFEEMKAHQGHTIKCQSYTGGTSVTVECETCGEILFEMQAGDSLDIKAGQ